MPVTGVLPALSALFQVGPPGETTDGGEVILKVLNPSAPATSVTPLRVPAGA